MKPNLIVYLFCIIALLNFNGAANAKADENLTLSYYEDARRVIHGLPKFSQFPAEDFEW